MDLSRLLIRLAMWWRNPPSPKRMKLILAVVAICLVIVLIEHLFGRPEWMHVEKVPIRRF
ncbi:hypothetical protein IAI18_13105 [Acetobacteraceae bacterium H6797]|nr:hypothetical protein [Acetobacteraceae bacterium H6797]